jgi:hypothetical protein
VEGAELCEGILALVFEVVGVERYQEVISVADFTLCASCNELYKTFLNQNILRSIS